QLDLEDQGRAARDARPPPVAVGDVGRADDLRLAARLHLLERLGPAGDDAGELELGRLAALVGAVELGAVGQRAAVVDLDLVVRRGRVAAAGLGLDVDQAGRGLDRALLLRDLLRVGLALLLLDGGAL